MRQLIKFINQCFLNNFIDQLKINPFESSFFCANNSFVNFFSTQNFIVSEAVNDLEPVESEDPIEISIELSDVDLSGILEEVINFLIVNLI